MAQPKSKEHLLALWECLVLGIGAVLGLCWVAFLIAENAALIQSEPRTWGVFLYAGISGMTMSGTVLLLIDRYRKSRRWRTGAFLFCVIGLGCWVFAPLLVIGAGKYMPLLGRFGLSDFLPLRGKTNAVAFAEAFFFNILPLLALLLLVTCLIGGHPVRRWWKCQAWWPEWFGMYLVIAWSLAGVWVIYQTYAKAL